MNKSIGEIEDFISQNILFRLKLIYESPESFQIVEGKSVFSENFIKENNEIKAKLSNYSYDDKLKSSYNNDYDIDIYYLIKCINFIFYVQQGTINKAILTLVYILNFDKRRCTIIAINESKLVSDVYFYKYEINETNMNIKKVLDNKNLNSLKNNILINF